MSENKEIDILVDIYPEEMGHKELYFCLKGLMAEVEENNDIIKYRQMRNLRTIKPLGKKRNHDEIKNRLKENSTLLGNIEQICKELESRGFEVPEVI